MGFNFQQWTLRYFCLVLNFSQSPSPSQFIPKILISLTASRGQKRISKTEPESSFFISIWSSLWGNFRPWNWGNKRKRTGDEIWNSNYL